MFLCLYVHNKKYFLYILRCLFSPIIVELLQRGTAFDKVAIP